MRDQSSKEIECIVNNINSLPKERRKHLQSIVAEKNNNNSKIIFVVSLAAKFHMYQMNNKEDVERSLRDFPKKKTNNLN